MEISGVIAVLTTLIALGSLTVAYLQYSYSKRNIRTAAEELAKLRQRLHGAYAMAVGGFIIANSIVRQCDIADETKESVQNSARLLRAQLQILSNLIKGEERRITAMFEDRDSAFSSSVPGRSLSKHHAERSSGAERT